MLKKANAMYAYRMRVLKGAYLLSICAILLYPFIVMEQNCSFAANASCVYGDEIRLIRDFGWDTDGGIEYHRGIDLEVSRSGEAPVFCGGTVCEIGDNNSFGKYVIIDHGESKGVYGNLTEIYVSEGDNLNTRDALGCVNEYLHFELRVNGVSVSPWDFLNDIGTVTVE